jgi:tRNA (guanine-N7-)-methyltransferase
MCASGGDICAKMNDKKAIGPDGTAWRNFYGRIRGKTLRPVQKAALADDLGPLTLQGVDGPRGSLDVAGLFGARALWLEVGFGGGEHLVAMAARYPEVMILGAEPFVNGIAMLLAKVKAAGVSNLALHPGDVRQLFDVLPDACLSRVFLNYPDPWPKQRHNRRRFVTPGYLGELARVMKPGGGFHVATDIPDYMRQTLAEVPLAGFTLVSGPGGVPWDDWVTTRYEQKALREGRVPGYVGFVRV